MRGEGEDKEWAEGLLSSGNWTGRGPKLWRPSPSVSTTGGRYFFARNGGGVSSGSFTFSGPSCSKHQNGKRGGKGTHFSCKVGFREQKESRKPSRMHSTPLRNIWQTKTLSSRRTALPSLSTTSSRGSAWTSVIYQRLILSCRTSHSGASLAPSPPHPPIPALPFLSPF